MNFLETLDVKVLVKREAQGMFDDLENFANLPQLRAQDFEKQALEYRHLAQPPKFHLMTQEDPLTLGGLHSGWYVTGLQLFHVSSHASAPNLAGENFPVIEVRGAVGIVESGTGVTVEPRICIGRSSDGGTTWTPLDGSGSTKNTSRALGAGSGDVVGTYDTVPQKNYMTGLTNYTPVNYPSDRMVQVVASFGGDSDWSCGNPASLNAYAIMINRTVDAVTRGWGWLELNARDEGR